MRNTCIFTIVSKNYLHYARSLMQSVAGNYDDAELIVVICDRDDGFKQQQEPFTIINIADLGIDNFEEFVFRYNILELNTAVKPFVFSLLLKKGHSQIIYFDPDIKVFNSLDSMVNLISQNNIVITPHLTGELNDGKRPNELDILKAGSYNLGYIGVNNTPESIRFIEWWMVRLRTQCVNDVSKGLFVDQKWVDLVPGMFKGVYINQNPGWNVAYWNINHRELTKDENEVVYVNGTPLVFFHFSGFKHKENILSIHQNRYSISSCDETLRSLFQCYADDLKLNDSDQVSLSVYGYNNFMDGSSIPNILREAYRKHAETANQMEMLSLEFPPDWLVELMNRPRDFQTHSTPFVTTLGYEIYLSRPDLQEAFPQIESQDARSYGGWFVASAEQEYGLSPQFSEPVLKAIEHEQTTASTPVNIGQKLFLKYHRTTFLKRLAGRILSAKVRKKTRKFLLEIGGGVEAPATLKFRQFEESQSALNILGYLHAESGTGEAARSTIRACNAARVDVVGIDIRRDNISRMLEVPETTIEEEPKYDINLFHINADQTPNIFENIKPEFYVGKYNIGFWFWELELLPNDYLRAYDFLDEIWVASTFCQNAISKKSSIPVSLIPLCVELNDPTEQDRLNLGVPDDSFLVFSSMDMLSIPERKNPLGVLKSFSNFCELVDSNTHLVLKLSNFDKCDPQLKGIIMDYVDRLPVVLIDQYMQRQELTNLMSACDCYLSLHRSEGFGLPIAEAMYLAKPVIATGWSSNMDFMNINNSYPVKYSLIPLEKDFGPYEQGNIWANPDLEHAALCLLEVFQQPEKASAKASQAARDIRKFNSPECVGEKIKNRLEFIHAH